MQVSVAKYPEMRVGAVRHVGPYSEIGEAFDRLGAIGGDLFALPGATMVGLYHDDPDSVPADQLRSDAAVVVPPETPLPAGLIEQRIPAGEYASTVHVGPYEQLPDVWRRFMGEELPATGRRVSDGVGYEVYHNTPMDTPPEKLRTEIRVPLAGA